MDDYSDDGGQIGCVFSFENIGKMEAAKTLLALHDIEEQLAANGVPSKVDASITPLGSITGQGSPFEHYRRVESNGYDAHTESVDEREVSSWKSAFSYLSLKGERLIASGTPGVSKGTDECFFPTPIDFKSGNLASSCSIHNGNIIQDLVIVGQKCYVPEVIKLSSDVDISQGTLEEFIAVHSGVTAANSDDSDTFDGDEISPCSSKRAEIVSLLLDALWPEVVEVLKPLVRRVVEVSRAEGLQYTTSRVVTESYDNEYESGGEERISVEGDYGSF